MIGSIRDAGPTRAVNMKQFAAILGLVAFALVVTVGWQVASCELADRQLQEDLHDIAGQGGVRIGFVAPNTDDDFRNAVISKAKGYGISLQPNQITVQRNPDEAASAPIYLAADYSACINLFAYSFTLHFTPSSNKEAAR